MASVWDVMRLNQESESVVVVPVGDLDGAEAAAHQAYEERFLFLLLLLRQPRLRMIYVTSMPVASAIVEYYLALLPGVIPESRPGQALTGLGGRLVAGSFSEKLLGGPGCYVRSRELIPNRSRSHLIPYNTTVLERDVALSLGIPMYGADPRLFAWGTKSGCRRLFAEEGVRHPIGFENLHT